MGLVTHIVALAYDQSASNAEKHLIASSFIALKDLCRLKAQEDGVEGENYIVDITGGAQNSPEPGPGQAYHVGSILQLKVVPTDSLNAEGHSLSFL